ncbi:glycosyltransferase family 39 protein [Patescibacteria group bacterium]|nr:glycosyltransferase family 39 protein [Patescibacteria group bacterium]MBU1256396.1 glycosyltransferase family 39 protein [Patescibacteria group bacterium]MBU1457423.1 glycosyltransferase family 39 protein [Patescibacteria group bacterium]
MAKGKISAVKVIFFLTLLFIPAIFDLLKPGYFPMHDDLQIFRLYELDKCVQDGQLPCRWIPDGGFGYGYPMFHFYPPLPYYPAEVMHLLGVSLFTSIEVMFILSLLLSGYFMYFLASEFFGTMGGLVAAVFYVYAPYHSLDVYVRGAMNEAWGMVWFPLILLFSYKLIKASKYNRKYFLGLSLSIAALLLSHNIMTMIFAPVAVIWSLFWFWQKKTWKNLKLLVLGGLLAIGLSAFFFIPVILEKSSVHVESITVGYFNYLAHFADLKQMFISRFWDYGSSLWGPDDDMAFPLGHFHWISAGIVGLLALFRFKKHKKERRLHLLIGLLLAVSLAYTFLVHSRSVWFWDNLPILYYTQFPWRLLTIPVFLMSFTAGALFMFIGKEPDSSVIPTGAERSGGIPLNCKTTSHRDLSTSFHFGRDDKRKILATLLITGVILWNLPFFKMDYPVNITREEKLSGWLWELQVTGGIFDYLPKTASRPPGDAGFSIPQFIEGNGGVLDLKRGSNWTTFTTNVSTENAKLMIPIFGYPGMKVKINNKQVQYQTDEDLGRIIIDLNRGVSNISVKLHKTLVRHASDLVSLLSLLVLFKIIYSKNE